MVSYKELRKKEVICIKDCRRLGHVCDLEMTMAETSRILKQEALNKKHSEETV